MPGCLIAMARLNRPSLMVYGGTIRAGCSPGHDKLDIVSAFQVSPPLSPSQGHREVHLHQ
jgi:dihydroxy-acid dehydratase